MNWIITLVIGSVVGWLASIVMKTNAQMGLVANVIVGTVGPLNSRIVDVHVGGTRG